MRTAKYISSIALLTALFLSGCATKYEVRVDALSAGSGSGAGEGYQLASATAGVTESDLFFKEIAGRLEPVLASRGFNRAEPGNAAIRIAVDAHLSEPLVETRSYAEPIYVEQPGYSRVYRIPVVNNEGKVVRYEYGRYYEPGRTLLSGWVDRSEQVTVYDKVLRLSARPILEDGKLGEEMWTITSALRDRSTDYRAALPYLLAAARDHIGLRTDGEVKVILEADSPEVQAIRPVR